MPDPSVIVAGLVCIVHIHTHIHRWSEVCNKRQSSGGLSIINTFDMVTEKPESLTIFG